MTLWGRLHQLTPGRAPAARLFQLDVQEPELGRPARSNLPLVRDIARTLMFAPAVRALADRVVAGISGGGGLGARAFNSVHLRLEKDARDWSIIMGGQAVRPLPGPSECWVSWRQHADIGRAPWALRGSRDATEPPPFRSGG